MRIWCLLREQEAYVRPVAAELGDRAEFLYDATWDPDAMLAGRPDLLLCVNDWPWDVARCLDAARTARIPSLVLQDGILEWRCQYENPLFGSGGGAPQHQPILADRIACMGAQSARQIAAWGNVGKVEVTGMPRLDHLQTRAVEPPRSPGTRLLVMTAKNPGYTPEQLAVTVRSLQDLREELDRRTDLEVSWRVSRNVAEMLGVATQLRQAASEELADSLAAADAVVSTPSTAILEAMLLGRPVAALDYHNVPRFVPTAWTISAREHVAPVLDELRSPPKRKMAFQRDTLADCLSTDSPAAPRVAELILRMAEEGRRARAEGRPLALPPSRFGAGEGASPGEAFALADLYPEAAAFAETDVRRLQGKLARLEKANEDLRRERAQRRLSDLFLRAGKRFALLFSGRPGAAR